MAAIDGIDFPESHASHRRHVAEPLAFHVLLSGKQEISVNHTRSRVTWGMSVQITYRMARPDDSSDVARYMCIAGGGLYEFLFDNLIPFVTAVDVLSAGIGGEQYPVSYRNCRVAALGHDGEIVAAANVFPADLLKGENYVLLGSERHNHIRPMLELQDWGSMYLNCLAVSDAHRGSGIGAKLLSWAEARTAGAGYDRLSLHVWADNIPAVNFYKARGFVQAGIAEIPPHPRLPHNGGSILMSKAMPPMP